MYALKGFAQCEQLINNTPGTLSPIGELSTFSLTFSQEKGIYQSSVNTGITLYAFLSNQDNTAVELTQDVVDHVVTIINHVYQRTIAQPGQQFADQILADLLNTYASVANTFECGNIVNNGTNYVPEWVSWINTSIPTIANNTLKVWLADASFQEEYDQFKIVVVPPLTPIDNFLNNPSSMIVTQLAQNDPATMMTNIQNAKQGFPETILTANVFNYHDPLNANNKIPTTWYLLIYGNAGNNLDAIQDALIQYILSNTTHTEAQWIQVFPDIFLRTEFTIAPLWNDFAIPNRTLETGIYSPICSPSQITTALTTVVNGAANYPLSQITQYAEVMANPYKSIMLPIVSGLNNQNSIFNITQLFPDYIAETSTSIDFNRMSLPTQQWANMLAQALVIAETMDQFTDLPVGFMKTIRNNYLFIAFRLNNIYYLIAAKTNPLQ